VAGLRQVAELAPANASGSRAQAARLAGLADTILAETAARCLSPDGRWMRSPQRPEVDASLVLPAVCGALAADDPRTVATLQAVLENLVEDGYVYRYVEQGRLAGQDEGAFLLCGFMVALALGHQGRDVEAARWFERTRAACGSPGLFTEEYDVRQRQLRGNLPQAFVHAALLETSATLHAQLP
jgi:GH15 family glucan-1,4-alpha-glucosidase